MDYKLYIMILGILLVAVLALKRDILFYKFKKNDKKGDQNKLAKKQADKEYKRFRGIEAVMPELFDAFRNELKPPLILKVFL